MLSLEIRLNPVREEGRFSRSFFISLSIFSEGFSLGFMMIFGTCGFLVMKLSDDL